MSPNSEGSPGRYGTNAQVLRLALKHDCTLIFSIPPSGVHGFSPRFVSLLNDWNATMSTDSGISIPSTSETCLRLRTDISRSAFILNFVPLAFSNSAVFSNLARWEFLPTSDHGSDDMNAGIFQFSSLRSAPSSKNIEKSPPCGPTQNLSSPPI